MSDPMDEFSKLLRESALPEKNKSVENQSIDKAMAAFDQKNASRSQGMGWRLRLMGTVKAVKPIDGGFMKKTYIAVGGLCAASLVVALLNTSSLNNDLAALKKDVATEDARVGFAQPAEPATMPAPAAEVMAAKVSARSGIVASLTPRVEGLAPAAPAAPILMQADQSAPVAFAKKESRDEVEKASSAAPQALMVAQSAPMPPMDAKAKIANGAVMSRAIVAQEPMPLPSYQDEGRDKFESVKNNPLKLTKDEPVSTFSTDVDTASYAFVRSSINQGNLPQASAVRIEEMINYFPYDYAVPKERTAPFAASVNVMPSPWNKGTKLIHIGIKGYDLPVTNKPHANLVFLVDTSGSMNEPNKLPLLQQSLKMLLESLQPNDSVAIVTYAGSAGVALEPTQVKDKSKILAVLDNMRSSGSTAGAEGIRQAYQLAERNFDAKGVNRVILATDGDFNVGITDQNELKSFIERKRDTGVTLSVLGFGHGNYNDALMQTLAQNGNGNAAYIDNLNEARKVLVQEASSTLFTIAKDVKIQVEFNPKNVSEYRLIGYETRMLNREDFNNDKVDAGDIGAGHTVTAIYEITPAGSDAKLVDPLRYGQQTSSEPTKHDNGSEYAFLKIRYKLPNENTSKLLTTPIDQKVEVSSIDKATTEARFATAVAGFGQLLRGGQNLASFSYNDVIALAESAKGTDTFGYRAEFINLVRLAKTSTAMKASPAALPAPVILQDQQ